MTGPSVDWTETQKRNLSFDDNGLLGSLYGEHDRHLARIEDKLDVVFSCRGNHVSIYGSTVSIDTAESVLRRLYKRLKDGHKVNPAEIDAVIRMAAQPEALRKGITTPRRQVVPRTPNQALYLRLLRESEMVFALGPAGTGKTYLAVAMAVSMLERGLVDRIVLSRPAVEAGERLGFLPGDLREKIDPYLRPLYDALFDTMAPDKANKRIDAGIIEIAPLAFMRGCTLTNAFAILDEAQNTTPMQMKMFLTRLGENSRMVITGDPSQVDLPTGQKSGLAQALSLLEGVEGIRSIRFDDADVVRHELVARIIRAYDFRDRAETRR